MLHENTSETTAICPEFCNSLNLQANYWAKNRPNLKPIAEFVCTIYHVRSRKSAVAEDNPAGNGKMSLYFWVQIQNGIWIRANNNE